MKPINQLAILLSMVITLSVSAQQGINYKALIKDGGGNIVSNQSIDVRFTIIADTGPANVYLETHIGVATDANGIIILNIGDGTSGDVFTDIAWSGDTHSLKVEIDIEQDASFVDMGTTQFMAVPYALSAGNAATKIDELSDGKSDANGSSVFLGEEAGLIDDGSDNKSVGIGYKSLRSSTGARNTAVGHFSLVNNAEGDLNTAVGSSALQFNTTGRTNTAIGYVSLLSNTEGESNTAVGTLSLGDNTTGSDNTAIGSSALDANTTGTKNTASGVSALTSNTEGINNTAAGSTALALNEVGSYNTAHGYFAGFNSLGDRNVFIGALSGFNETGSNKLYIENSNANADNALIYGEFGPDLTSTANVLRTNSEFQIGNPTVTGYAFPTTDGTANQIMQTNGNGSLSWGTASSQSINGLVDGKSDNDGTENGSSVFLGLYAGLNDDGTGNGNAGLGYEALKTNTSGGANISIGYQSLKFNTIGSFNSATGFRALYINSSGSENTATGYEALSGNTTGNQNTASGFRALVLNSSGSWNTANGYQALFTNSTGYSNVANGYYALHGNTTGFYNTASGVNALRANTTGKENTAIGHDALRFNTTGFNNIGIGNNAQASSSTASNQVTIGNNANNVYRMYAASWTNASDRELKHNIKNIPVGLDFVLKLRPVEFVYNNANNEEITFGFIAQEVQEVVQKSDLKDNILVSPLNEKYLGLQTTELISVLTKAIQEQQEIIDELTDEKETHNKNYEKLLKRVEQLELVSNQ